MRYLFLGCLVLLIGAGVLTSLSLPDARSDVPVIYWVTDSNPARYDQVRLFHQWMLRQGHYQEFSLQDANEALAFVARNVVLKDLLDVSIQPRGEDIALIRQAIESGSSLPSTIQYPLIIRLPKAKLDLDMGNRDATKQIIQGVSGVAGDIQDVNGGGDMRYFRQIGLNTDVTEAARQLGFDISTTYRALEPEMTIAGDDGVQRQYQYPCNVTASLYFVNRDMFRQHGQPLPPMRWTLSEFEKRGKAFVDAANRGRARRTVFFADGMDMNVIRASLGGSRFNETGTRCTLDEPANIEATRLLRKWTFEDRLFPSAADRAGFNVESGYGGLHAQLFTNNADPDRGQIGLMWTGRYLLIEFRKSDKLRKERGEKPIDYGLAEAPHGGFPNTSIGTRAAMVYAGSEHRELATYFLAFLASEEYNMQIVRDADALPPVPKYTQTDEYIRPAEFPNEWDVHKGFADATDFAIGASYSPFILHRSADRIEVQTREKFMQETPLEGFETPEKTAREQTRLMHLEMQRTLDEDPSLKPLYEKALKDQARIDQMKEKIRRFESANRSAPLPDELKIPRELITNAFHQAYYKHKGWVK